MQDRPTVKPKISARKLAVLLLLNAPNAAGNPAAPIRGTTRMQKLVFLVTKRAEGLLEEDEAFRVDFSYDADKFGPADLDLYQDLEFLKAARLISIDRLTGIAEEGVSPPSESGEPPSGPELLPEEQEENELSFDYLMGERTEEIDIAEAETKRERVYQVTPLESGFYEKLAQSLNPGAAGRLSKLQQVCRSVKQEFGDWPLEGLLRYVYTNYPDTIRRSSIVDRILRK